MKSSYRETSHGKEKLCTGPSHPPGGVWLTEDKFWKYGAKNKNKPAGMWFYRCIVCMKFPKRVKLGWIESDEQIRMLKNYKKISRTTFKTVKGVLYKRCAGPAHDKPTWLPATNKYFYFTRRGTYYNRCRLCVVWSYAEIPEDAGFIPVDKVIPFFKEAVFRVGKMETCRRIQLTDKRLRQILGGESQFVKKATFKRLMIELVSMRRKNEVRHKDSIRHGASMRGRTERVPINRRDFYHPHGDEDNERRSNYRKEHREEENARVRERNKHGRRTEDSVAR
jgi:hypothetical protein